MTGLLLAGGRSTRMGRDKALLDWTGEPLAARVTRVLASLCAEVVVASGDGRRLGWLGLPQVADAAARAGPLGGLVAGLERAAHPLVAVVAVDMPHASAPVLRLLAERWEGEPAVVARADGRLQPLHAVWAGAAAPALRARLAAGHYSVGEAARALGAQVGEPGQWAPADPSGRFARNLNRPDDLPGGRR
ncbi:MAG TPA: molybdenum cofactor guanylyltransferase [Egibacteraceae bacterium]|nr:molybdenum cofactor guanylyltransferase [Egibacteraceae bacterium]